MRTFLDSGDLLRSADDGDSPLSWFESNQSSAFKRRLFLDNLRIKLSSCNDANALPWLNPSNPFLPIGIDSGLFLDGLNRMAVQATCVSNDIHGPIIVRQSQTALPPNNRDDLHVAYGAYSRDGEINLHQYIFTSTDDEFVSLDRPSLVEIYESLISSVEESGINIAVNDSVPTAFFPKAQAIVIGDSALLSSNDQGSQKMALASLVLACTSAFCSPVYGSQCEEIEDCERLEKNLAYKPFSKLNHLRQSYLAGAFSKRYGLGIEEQIYQMTAPKALLGELISLLKDPDDAERHLLTWDSISYRAAVQAGSVLQSLESEVLSMAEVEKQRILNATHKAEARHKAKDKSFGVIFPSGPT